MFYLFKKKPYKLSQLGVISCLPLGTQPPLPWCRKGGGAEMTDSVQEECPRIAVQTAATIQEEGPKIAAQTAATSPTPSPYL